MDTWYNKGEEKGCEISHKVRKMERNNKEFNRTRLSLAVSAQRQVSNVYGMDYDSSLITYVGKDLIVLQDLEYIYLCKANSNPTKLFLDDKNFHNDIVELILKGDKIYIDEMLFEILKEDYESLNAY